MNKHSDSIKEGNKPKNELTEPIKELNASIKPHNEPTNKLTEPIIERNEPFIENNEHIMLLACCYNNPLNELYVPLSGHFQGLLNIVSRNYYLDKYAPFLLKL